MHPESLILSTLLLINSLGGIANPFKQAQTQICRDPGSIPADEATRSLELPQFGVTLAIPSNFRAVLRNNGTVEIVNPGTYEVLTCVAQGGQALGRGYFSITVQSIINSKNLDLQEFVEQNSLLKGNISPYNFNGQVGYFVQSPLDSSAQFWLKPTASSSVTIISAGCDCRGMSDRLVTLLERSRDKSQ
jgi:hypothetical protein